MHGIQQSGKKFWVRRATDNHFLANFKTALYSVVFESILLSCAYRYFKTKKLGSKPVSKIKNLAMRESIGAVIQNGVKCSI
jgi:hypothetical protein